MFARHGHGDSGVGVRKLRLVGTSSVFVDGPEGHAGHLGADTAGVCANARSELGVVVDDFEHFSSHNRDLSVATT